MMDFKIGDIIKIQVIGSQPYGIFVRALDNLEYTGLIHISEISNDFIKDVNKIAKLDDYLYAKILDINKEQKHLKLSIKALNGKQRYKTSSEKILTNDPRYKDFKPLDEMINNWIIEQLKEKNQHDSSKSF